MPQQKSLNIFKGKTHDSPFLLKSINICDFGMPQHLSLPKQNQKKNRLIKLLISVILWQWRVRICTPITNTVRRNAITSYVDIRVIVGNARYVCNVI